MPETSATSSTRSRLSEQQASPRELLSILVPVYNEEEFVGALLDRVIKAPLPDNLDREIIIVDDGSYDGSSDVIQRFADDNPGVRVIRHLKNRGKGAAIRSALEDASGEYCLIQDADLEYNPAEYPLLLEPLLSGQADAVFGSRFLVSGRRRVLYFWHSIANRLITNFCNLASDLNLTDTFTCYKAFRTSLLKSIPLTSDRFGFEPEITIKLAKREARIYEVPVSYHGRTYDEGKKVRPSDGFKAIATILRHWISSDIYKDSGPEILDAFASASDFNRWMADTIRPWVGAKVLEIGAGMGNLTRHLIPRRQRYIATDIDREHLNRLQARLKHRPNLEVRFCDLAKPGDFDELENSVQSVVCLNVLEHVEDDYLGARNIFRTLQPGGYAIILVPQGQWAYGKIDEALGHFRRYSHDQLTKCLAAAGFEVERVLEFNRMSLPGWYLNGKLMGRSTISPFQLRVFNRFVWLWRRIDRMLPWGPTSIIAIARKP